MYLNTLEKFICVRSLKKIYFTVACIPSVGILIGHNAFDLSILYSRREVTHLFLLILTILFRPWVGILIFFFSKMSKSPPYARPPPPLGLTLIVA